MSFELILIHWTGVVVLLLLMLCIIAFLIYWLFELLARRWNFYFMAIWLVALNKVGFKEVAKIMKDPKTGKKYEIKEVKEK